MPRPSSSWRKETVQVVYVNHRGERSIRKIKPSRLFFGTSMHHGTPQWLLDCFDYDRDAYRTYAMADILVWDTGDLG